MCSTEPEKAEITNEVLETLSQFDVTQFKCSLLPLNVR